MLQLHNLESLTKNRKRVGRGGGRGGTSGRGHKGQRARSGGKMEIKTFFEGGQMPLSRRLPRRGFTNIFKKNFFLIGLNDLDTHFDDGTTVTEELLREKGLVRGRKSKKVLIKVLCNGELTKKLTVQADAWSKSAEAAVKKAGGVLERRPQVDLVRAPAKEAEGGITS